MIESTRKLSIQNFKNDIRLVRLAQDKSASKVQVKDDAHLKDDKASTYREEHHHIA